MSYTKGLWAEMQEIYGPSVGEASVTSDEILQAVCQGRLTVAQANILMLAKDAVERNKPMYWIQKSGLLKQVDPERVLSGELELPVGDDYRV